MWEVEKIRAIFTVPGSPVGKGRPRMTRTGHTYTPEKTARYENLVALEYQTQCAGQFFEGAVRMTVRCYYGIAKSDSKKRRAAKLEGNIRPTKKPDCDNVLKSIADALNGIAYADDAQIVHATVEKWYSEKPRVEVVIESEVEE